MPPPTEPACATTCQQERKVPNIGPFALGLRFRWLVVASAFDINDLRVETSSEQASREMLLGDRTRPGLKASDA